MTEFGRALINITIIQGEKAKEKRVLSSIPVQQGREPMPKNYEANPDVPINPIEDEYNSVGDMLDKYLMKNITIPVDGEKRKKKKKFVLRAFEEALIRRYKK